MYEGPWSVATTVVTMEICSLATILLYVPSQYTSTSEKEKEGQMRQQDITI